MDMWPSNDDHENYRENYKDKLHEPSLIQRPPNNIWKKIALTSLVFALVLGVLVVALAVKVLVTPPVVIHNLTSEQTPNFIPTHVTTAVGIISTPTPTLAPTPSPTIATTGVICQAGGWQGWALSSDWKTVDNNTLLVDDGSHISNLEGPTAIPPCTVPNSVQNFAIEATITSPQPNSDTHFGMTVCGSTTDSGWQGYEGIFAYEYYGDHHVQIWVNTDKQAEASFDPGITSHTYRLEVKGNVITMFVDGVQIAQATDNKFITCGRQVGLLSSLVVLHVSSFKLIAL